MCHFDQAKQKYDQAGIKRLMMSHSSKFFQENEHQLCSELHDRHQVRAQLIKDKTRVCFYNEQTPDKTLELLWRESTNHHLDRKTR